MPKIKSNTVKIILSVLTLGMYLYPQLTNPEGRVAGALTTKPIQVRGASVITEKAIIDPISIKTDGIKAQSALVTRLDDNVTVTEIAGDASLPIASLTKIMTGYLAITYLNFQQEYEVKNNPETNISPSLKVTKGDSIRIQDLFEAMMVASANDAAYVLADALTEATGKDMNTLMNETARQLGMLQTRYVDPAGLSAQNQSSVKDITLLAKECLKHPAFELLGKTKSISFESLAGRKFNLRATNKIIDKVQGLNAFKTGHTEEAKGAMVTRLELPTSTYIIVVLGSYQRERDTLLLAERIKEQTQ